MKQYLTPDQTAKLIELGFEKPKSISGFCQRGPYEYDAETNTKMVVYDDTQYPIYAYSIGELIGILPAKIDGIYCNIDRCGQRSWAISYDPMIYCCNCAELVDALYNMVVKLKEQEVI